MDLAGTQKCALGSLGNMLPFPHRPSHSFSGVSTLDSGILEALAVTDIITREDVKDDKRETKSIILTIYP